MTGAAGPFEPGEKILLIDQRDRTYLFTLQAKGTYHTHSGTLAPRGADREAGGHQGRDLEGDGLRGVPPAVRRLRAEDAARRPGRLPEGPRADRDLRRRVPGRAGPGGRHRVGRADDRPLPCGRRDGPGRLLRAARRAPRAARRATSRPSSATMPPTLELRDGRPRRGRPRRGSGTTVPCSTCPSRGGRCRRSRGCSSRAASSAPTCPRRSRSSSWCWPCPAPGSSTWRPSRRSSAAGT